MVFNGKSLTLMVMLVVVLFSGGVLLAQDPEARITGVVRDATGVGIPGVTITLTNQSTRTSLVATTGGDGAYTVNVPPGTYAVVATLSGWRRVTSTATVAAGASVSIDFSLQPSLSEEITVTSMKRDETLHNVPFSVAAPTEKVLRERGVEDLEGVAANVSGFTVQNLGPGQSQVAMRGISSGQIVRDQPGVKEQVASYLDESAVSLSLFTPDLDLFDVGRIEVLRGPQVLCSAPGLWRGRFGTSRINPSSTQERASPNLAAALSRAGVLEATPSLASTCRSVRRPHCGWRHTSAVSQATWTPCNPT